MAQFRWIIMSSFFMLLVQFTAAAVRFSSSAVRVGDEVTLSCGNVTDDQKCDSIEWLFTGSGNRVTLFEHGQIQEEAEAKSDRLSVTENCSLVIKKVTDDDAGYYTCRKFRSGQLHGGDTQVFLNVVNMTEQKNDDMVTLICYVSQYFGCGHTVKWLYEGDKTDVATTQLDCSATVTALKALQTLRTRALLQNRRMRLTSGSLLCSLTPLNRPFSIFST
ncbi:uncharacterized protein LOC144533408 [Sander vitreus]